MPKIRLLMDLPVADEHGMRRGRIFADAVEERNSKRGGVRWWVIGDQGEKVGVLKDEAEVLDA